MNSKQFTCSVVIPCYNEAGTIAGAIRRVPKMGAHTEVIVVDDGSVDGTADVVRALQAEQSDLRLISYRENRGKGHAVARGFQEARGDVLMILDADMSVAPEELPLFLEPLVTGRARFANGTRMVHPMEPGAMTRVNRVGNRIFSRIVFWLIGQRITDSLCGTKALLREDYARIPMRDSSWGDFDLLCATRMLGLPLAEVPIHYRRRASGVSKMRPLKHGLILLKVCFRWFLVLKLGQAARSAPKPS